MDGSRRAPLEPLDDPALANLGGLIAGREDGHPWLIDVDADGHDQVYSYGDLRRLSAGVAGALRRQGLPAGARVGLLGGNCPEYLLTYYGIMQAGCCAVPIGVKLARETVVHMLDDAEVALLFADRIWRERLDGLLPCLPLDEPAAWRALLADDGADMAVCAPGDPATVLYTSGSTGLAKGVPLTHGGYLWTLRQLRVNGGEAIHETAARVLTAAPLSHMNALLLSKLVSAYGGTLVLMRRFDPAQFLAAIDRHRCSVVTAVPTMLAWCLREPDCGRGLDLSCVSSVAMGSAPVTDSLFEQVASLFPNAVVVNNWGTTETGPAVFGPHPGGRPRPRLALGVPLPAVEVRLVGPLAPDEGELWVRNGAVMPGYLNRPEESARRLVDGWYRTGDLMRRDADDFYYFVGRVDDMFVCGGENLYPGEIERLLERHPAVAQAAVIAIDDAIKGQIPVAFVVLRPGHALDEQALKAYALAQGPVYAHPRRVRFVERLPLSAANKIDRATLKDWSAALRR